MSKADLIREMLESTDYSNREIARRVDCLDAYVRVVQQRLAGGGRTSPADRKYYAANRKEIIRKASIRTKRTRARRKQPVTLAT